VALCAALFAASPAGAPAAPQAAGKAFTLEALYALPRIIGTAPKVPAWSPDGRAIAFLWNEEGTNFFDVYVTRTDDPKPVRLTAMPRRTPGAGQASSPEAVAEAEAVESDPGVTSVAWHPDGERLLFSFRQGRYVLAPGREPEQVTEATGLEPGAVFSPDGKLQAFVRAGALLVRPLGGPAAAARELVKPAAAGIRLRVNAWSPDGRRILVTEIDGRKMPRRKIPDYLPAETEVREAPRAFPGEDTSTQRIGVADASSGTVLWLDFGDRPVDMVTSLAWSPDGRSVLVDACDKYVKDRSVLVAEAGTGAVREWVRERNPVNVTPGWQARWAPDGKGIYFLSDRNENYHIYFLSGPGAEPVPITRGAWAVSSFEVRPAAKAIFFVANGAILHGRLTLPPGLDKGRKHPAILGSVYSDTVRNQWGGRTAHPTWGLDQYLLQQGYVLLNVDVRGSEGHGAEYRQGLFQGYGVIDIEDLHSGVEYLKTLGFVDADRVGVWGSSYGGLMTTMSLFKKPGVYKAGVAGAPATNVFHAQPGQMWVMMDPRDHREKYEASSPCYHAAGLRDRLMIIHGMRDTVVLYKDTVVLVDRLIGLGKDVDLVTLPDSEHSWDTGPSRQTIFAFRKLAEHFERYLGKGPR